tara:strand:+ start:338 stop:595 length:258 start_codon:yes stop_codon:yes gene_type:complete
MYKKTLFTLLIFFAPIAFIEQLDKDSKSQIINNKYDTIKKNNPNLINSLFENDENIILIKDCWEKGDLLSQKRYCSSNEKFFHNF